MKWVRRRPALAGLLSVSVLATVLVITLLGMGYLRISRLLDGQRRTAYGYQIALAEQAYLANDIGEADRTLADCPADLRRWEWNYLRRLCHPERLLLPGLGGGAFSPLAFSHKGEILAVAHPWNDLVGGVIELWDVGQKKRLSGFITGHKDVVTCLAFSGDGWRLISGSDDGTVKVWDAGTQKEITTFQGHTFHIKAVALSPDGRLAVSVVEQGSSSTSDGRTLQTAPDDFVCLWDADTGKVRHRLPNTTGPVAFSPDGKQVLAKLLKPEPGPSGPIGPGICLYDVETARPVRCLDSSAPKQATFSPDGRLIAGNDYGLVRVWHWQEPKGPANRQGFPTLPRHLSTLPNARERSRLEAGRQGVDPRSPQGHPDRSHQRGAGCLEPNVLIRLRGWLRAGMQTAAVLEWTDLVGLSAFGWKSSAARCIMSQSRNR